MADKDPLALRHGAFISTIWSQIAEARKLVTQGPSTSQSATQLRRIRHLRKQVHKVHQIEMQRQDFSTPAIDGWFQPVEESLEKAEDYFAARVICATVTQAQAAPTHAT